MFIWVYVFTAVHNTENLVLHSLKIMPLAHRHVQRSASVDAHPLISPLSLANVGCAFSRTWTLGGLIVSEHGVQNVFCRCFGMKLALRTGSGIQIQLASMILDSSNVFFYSGYLIGHPLMSIANVRSTIDILGIYSVVVELFYSLERILLLGGLNHSSCIWPR